MLRIARKENTGKRAKSKHSFTFPYFSNYRWYLGEILSLVKINISVRAMVRVGLGLG